MTRVTTLNLPDFHRNLLGFDRLVEDFQNFNNAGYPPYNVEKSGDDKYQITLALAGFVRDDIKIDIQEGTLTVTGEKVEAKMENGMLYIALERIVPEEKKPKSIKIK